MKIIIFLIIMLISLIPSSVAKASSYSYSWENTYIDVLIETSIYNYTHLPVAKLYSDGKELTDADISYNRNGDWLYYLRDVNTNKPGEYKVWYKAYDNRYKPGTCENYKALITFNVIDDIKPEITLLQDEINVRVGSKPENLNLKGLYSVRDNLVDDYKENINLSLVDFNKVGKYEAIISVIDSAGNSDKKEFTINVLDKEGPVINYHGKGNKLTLEKGKEIDWLKYFTATDNVDGNVFSTILVEGFDNNKIGVYNNVKISFRDKENNYSYYYLVVEVVDLIFPTLELNQEQISMQYETPFSPELFTKYIKQANDNGVNMFDDVKIDLNELINQVGNYTVHYSLIDEDGNETKRDLKVNLVSLVKPSIRTEAASLRIGEEIDFSNYYHISDESDPNILDNVKIDDSSFDNSKAGIYYITITCFNSSGLYNHGVIEVEVIDEASKKQGFFTPTRIIIICIILLILIMCGVYYLIKRKQQKKLLAED